MLNGLMKKLPVLKKNYEFSRVYNKGRYASSGFLVIYVLKNRLEKTRIGITASKKVGKSVERNRIRRLIRENLRLLGDRLALNVDIVIVARKTEDTVNLDIIGRELKYLLHKLNLLNREN